MMTKAVEVLLPRFMISAQVKHHGLLSGGTSYCDATAQRFFPELLLVGFAEELLEPLFLAVSSHAAHLIIF